MQDIASEIALDIGLRQRLLQTVESRIQWAIILRQALVDGESAVEPIFSAHQFLRCFRRFDEWYA